LNEFQRSGVPLYLLYPENQGQPEVLPQILLESTVIDALNRAKT
jgi:thiol:disulfide interchange protein